MLSSSRIQRSRRTVQDGNPRETLVLPAGCPFNASLNAPCVPGPELWGSGHRQKLVCGWSHVTTACCLLLLPRRGPGVRLRTLPSQTHLRLRELMPCPKECCGTSCDGRKWRESSRCPVQLPRPPMSDRRIRLSSASRLGLQCSSICQFRRKCDGLLGPPQPIPRP